MVRSLPSQPSLENLRKQAKGILKDFREAKPEILDLFKAHLPRLKGAGAEVLAKAKIKLSEAQFVLAKDYGFESWPDMVGKLSEPKAGGAGEFDRLRDLLEAGDDAGALKLAKADLSFLARRDPNRQSTPLHHAAWHGRAAVVRGLLDMGAELEAAGGETGGTPLHHASGMNRLEAARALLERGANPKARDKQGMDPLSRALYYEDPKPWLELFLPKGGTRTLFTDMAAGDEAALRARVKAEPSSLKSRHPFSGNVTLSPLHYAANRNKPGLVLLLLELGAEPGAKDELGRTAADLALSMGKLEAYKALASQGFRAGDALLARVRNPERAGLMAGLHGALVAGDLGAVKDFIQKDPSLVNAKLPDVWGTGGTGGAAPLHWAAMFGHVALAEFLLSQGADLEIKDDTYQGIPLGWAREFHRGEMEAFLTARGRKQT